MRIKVEESFISYYPSMGNRHPIAIGLDIREVNLEAWLQKYDDAPKSITQVWSCGLPSFDARGGIGYISFISTCLASKKLFILSFINTNIYTLNSIGIPFETRMNCFGVWLKKKLRNSRCQTKKLSSHVYSKLYLLTV